MSQSQGRNPLVNPFDGPRGRALADRRLADLARVKKFRKRMIDEEVPAELDVHLILDNYSAHKTNEVKRWLIAPSN